MAFGGSKNKEYSLPDSDNPENILICNEHKEWVQNALNRLPENQRAAIILSKYDDLCQKELDAYHNGKLPEVIRIQVEVHLEGCEDCAKINQLITHSDKVMDEEKNLQSNPFLITRIMAGIEELAPGYESYQSVSVSQKVQRSAMITVSLAVTILIGVATGNLYKPNYPVNKLPVEMLYLNDAALESIELLSNE